MVGRVRDGDGRVWGGGRWGGKWGVVGRWGGGGGWAGLITAS